MGSVCRGMTDAAQRLLISCCMRTAIIWVTCTLLKPPGRQWWAGSCCSAAVNGERWSVLLHQSRRRKFVDLLTSFTDLQVSDVERLLIDVDGVGARCQSAHSGQVATVAPHCLNDEDPPLGAAGWLLDAITCLNHTHTHTDYTVTTRQNGTFIPHMQQQNALK